MSKQYNASKLNARLDITLRYLESASEDYLEYDFIVVLEDIHAQNETFMFESDLSISEVHNMIALANELIDETDSVEDFADKSAHKHLLSSLRKLNSELRAYLKALHNALAYALYCEAA